MRLDIPEKVKPIAEKIKGKGNAYIIGGFVRDSLMGLEPSDIDIFTDLQPDELKEIFPKGSVMGTAQRHERLFTLSYNDIEISTFRKNGERTEYGKTLKEHVLTCDFSVNAIAMDIFTGEVIDYVDGQEDIRSNRLLFVGEPELRIKEDPLRLIRAIRFASTRGFNISLDSLAAIKDNAHLIKTVGKQRIRDEFIKFILGNDVMNGMLAMYHTNLMLYLFPELVLCYGHYCGKSHKYDVFMHIATAVNHAPKDLETRLALFFHDQMKPKAFDGEHFLKHELYSAKLAKKRLKELGFKRQTMNTVSMLVENHMFSSRDRTDGVKKMITPKAVRKLVAKVGKEHIYQLMDIRDADRHANNDKMPDIEIRDMVYDILKNETALKITDMKINGTEVMDILQIGPCKEVGDTLKALFKKVMDTPELNTKEKLTELAKEVRCAKDE